MGDFLAGVGTFILVVMALIGLIAGWIAGRISGRNKGLYIAVGILGSVAIPFVFAALGIGALAAGGVVAILMAATIGAVVLLVLGKLVFDR